MHKAELCACSLSSGIYNTYSSIAPSFRHFVCCHLVTLYVCNMISNDTACHIFISDSLRNLHKKNICMKSMACKGIVWSHRLYWVPCYVHSIQPWFMRPVSPGHCTATNIMFPDVLEYILVRRFLKSQCAPLILSFTYAHIPWHIQSNPSISPLPEQGRH